MISSFTGDKSSTHSTSSDHCNSISLLHDNTTIENVAVINPDDNNPAVIDGYNTTIDNEAVNNPDDNNPTEIDGCTTKSSIGRPKGSTSSFYMDLKERIELATRETVKRLEAEKRKKRSSKAQLSKDSLDIIIAAAKDKFAIPDDLELNKVTIRKRVERHSVDRKRGLKSTMLEVEPYLVKLIIKLADMRTPISTSQGLQLTNSLIKGTSIEEKVIQ
jgi:hypothetical protein